MAENDLVYELTEIDTSLDVRSGWSDGYDSKKDRQGSEIEATLPQQEHNHQHDEPDRNRAEKEGNHRQH